MNLLVAAFLVLRNPLLDPLAIGGWIGIPRSAILFSSCFLIPGWFVSGFVTSFLEF